MANPANLSRAELEKARDIGVATYLSAYGRLMARELGIDETDTQGINRMMFVLIEPMNLATEAMWRALMEDHEGTERITNLFRDKLDNLLRGV